MPVVMLGPEMGIDSSADLKALLAVHIDSVDEIVLAAPEVDRPHTASLQVLVAFFRTRRGLGRATRIEPCAGSLREAASTLGLTAELGLPQHH